MSTLLTYSVILFIISLLFTSYDIIKKPKSVIYHAMAFITCITGLILTLIEIFQKY